MRYYKIRNVKDPIRGTEQSAGLDFFVPEEWNSGKTFTVKAGESVLIPSGVKLNVPEGYALIAFNKSGVAVKKKLYAGACVVDEDYQGEVHFNLTNVGNEDTTISPGEKIIQFLLIEVNYAEVELAESEEDLWKEKVSERGEGGFGSTGTY